jgi:hypothetical protein
MSKLRQHIVRQVFVFPDGTGTGTGTDGTSLCPLSAIVSELFQPRKSFLNFWPLWFFSAVSTSNNYSGQDMGCMFHVSKLFNEDFIRHIN